MTEHGKDFWKRSAAGSAGEDELERSGSSSSPAGAPTEAGGGDGHDPSPTAAAAAGAVASGIPPMESGSPPGCGSGGEDAAADVPEEPSASMVPEESSASMPEETFPPEGREEAAEYPDDAFDDQAEEEGDGVGDAAADGGLTPEEILEWEGDPPLSKPNLGARRRGSLYKRSERPVVQHSPQQKLLLLDTWARSGLPARDFGALVDVSRHSLYAWKRRFEQLGPAGLMEQPRGGKPGSRLPDLTRRTILMLKQAHPDWGCQRISDMLIRGPALPASPAAVRHVLHEAGYEMQEVPTRSHTPPVRSFERAKPNQLWQTDLFTFMLKRQNRRVYLVAFMDDHSRFVTGFGLHATQSAALVIEVFRAALAANGVPGEILTDNGSQYVTWRGKSQFSRELEKRGIRQIVARPRRPQTLGKIERFWGSLWRECVETAIFLDLADARQRIGLYIDYYNLQRPHQGIEGLVPADRFFSAAPQVLKTLKERVAANALELARHGVPKKPFYLTGQLDGKPFSVHREGDRVILRQAGQAREEIELVDPAAAAAQQPAADAEALPQALCPDGSPTSPWLDASDEVAMPGESPLDGLYGVGASDEPPVSDSSTPSQDEDPPAATSALGGDA